MWRAAAKQPVHAAPVLTSTRVDLLDVDDILAVGFQIADERDADGEEHSKSIERGKSTVRVGRRPFPLRVDLVTACGVECEANFSTETKQAQFSFVPCSNISNCFWMNRSFGRMNHARVSSLTAS